MELLQATKDTVLRQIGEAECVHLTTHVSWKLSAIVFSPGDVVDSQHSKRFFANSDHIHDQGDEESSEGGVSNLKPSQPMEFASPALWPAYERRFLCYMSVSGHSSKSHIKNIDILLYVLGDRAEEIWTQFELEQDMLELSLKELSKYFTSRTNTLFERYKFISRVQLIGETVGDFVMALHTLQSSCDYGALKNKLILDRVVVGMADRIMSQQLQLHGQSLHWRKLL
ncbi:hypothetical protein PR048_011290 [Dryococelus australis]|uniref:Uncharacterized protein n=1 Tax=Dryococelus australis TaxID=614101 RepID=A0ABQ9HL61_9NEOP|nr:hypothetical protein PR048_011290 [Dryococelus australis]